MEEREAETVPLPRLCAVPKVRPSPPLSSYEYHSTTTVGKNKSVIVCEIITRFQRETDNYIAGSIFHVSRNKNRKRCRKVFIL